MTVVNYGEAKRMNGKVLILDGNPDGEAFCGALAGAAAQGARAAGRDVRLIRLSDLAFDPNLMKGYKTAQRLEPDLEKVRDALVWCDRMILVHPLWWGSAPAKLKGLFDRVLLSGFAFKFVEGRALPVGLLKGRSAHVLITSDTPGWYLRWVYGTGWTKIIRKQILEYCGFGKVRIDTLGPMISSDERRRTTFLATARKAGARSR